MCSQDINIKPKYISEVTELETLSKYQTTPTKKSYKSSVEILLEGKNIIATSTTRVMEAGVSVTGEEWKKWY